MDCIYPITALTKQQQEVKDAARDGIVRITEHGMAAWVFASEEAFDQRVSEEVERALYDARVQTAVARGERDYERGRFVVGTDAAKTRLTDLRRQSAHTA